MSTKVILNEAAPPVHVNVMPVKIQYSGDADTKNFFTSTKAMEDFESKRVTTANFRGLRLVGEDITLVNKVGHVCNYHELLVSDPKREGEIMTCKEYSSDARFESLTIFGHDSLPPRSSKWRLIEEWDAIADAIHS